MSTFDFPPAGSRHSRTRVSFSDPLAPVSLAYFCSRCGTIWARRVSNESSPRFVVQYAVCEPCGDGTLIFTGQPNTDQWSDLSHLPRAVLEREVLVLGARIEAARRDPDRFIYPLLSLIPLAKETLR